MGISQFIVEKKSARKIKRPENIELLRPIVNVLIGAFAMEEKEALIHFLNERIGSMNKVNYCQFAFGEQPKMEKEEQIKVISVSDIDSFEDVQLSHWETMKISCEKSQHLAIDVKNYVNYIFNQVSTEVYDSKGRIHLNFIVKADSIQASGMETLIRVMKEEFKEYFSNGVGVDTYCILDQIGYSSEEHGEERKALNYMTLNLLDSLAEKKLVDMSYLMSNYTSLDCLEPTSQNEIMRTIGLALLVKDGKSADIQENDTYKDVSFQDDTSMYQGNFYTLGNLKLEVNEEAREFIVYKAIFDDLCEVSGNNDILNTIYTQMELEKDVFEKQGKQLLQFDFLNYESTYYPMILTPVVNRASFLNDTNESVIASVFGRHLEYFWDLNAKVKPEQQNELTDQKVKKINKLLRDAYVSSQCSLAEIYELIHRVKDQLYHLYQEYDRECADIKIEYRSWLSKKVNIANLKDVNKETKVPKAVYVLAKQEMMQRMRLAIKENMRYIASQCYQKVLESELYYKSQSETVKNASAELDETISFLEQEPPVLVNGNIRAFYTQLTHKVIDENPDYKSFKQELNNKICTKEIMGEQIYDEVLTYCDTKILASPHFVKDLSAEMVLRLKNFDKYSTEEAVYDLAYDTITGSRKYYANHTEVGGIFDAICFLVNPNNQFVNSTNERMKKLLASQHLKFFFEHHFDGMDVLFMEGRFCKDAIYQYQLYERVYKKLSEC